MQLVAQSIPGNTPVFALLLDDNTRFSHDRRWDGACSRDASGRAGLNGGLFSETMDFRSFPSVLSAVRIAQS